jgi:hypothetical protein
MSADSASALGAPNKREAERGGHLNLPTDSGQARDRGRHCAAWYKAVIYRRVLGALIGGSAALFVLTHY